MFYLHVAPMITMNMQLLLVRKPGLCHLGFPEQFLDFVRNIYNYTKL
jgi:hypothetical protein